MSDNISSRFENVKIISNIKKRELNEETKRVQIKLIEEIGKKIKKAENEKDINLQNNIILNLFEELSLKISKKKYYFITDCDYEYFYELISDYFIIDFEKYFIFENMLNNINLSQILYIPSVYSLLFYKFVKFY
jgi:hypothetical protein